MCAWFLWCGFSHFRTPTIFSHIFGKTLGLVDMAAAHYSLSQGRLVSRHASNNPHEKEEHERAGLDLRGVDFFLCVKFCTSTST